MARIHVRPNGQSYRHRAIGIGRVTFPRTAANPWLEAALGVRPLADKAHRHSAIAPQPGRSTQRGIDDALDARERSSRG
jgi:hypothetical protein